MPYIRRNFEGRIVAFSEEASGTHDSTDWHEARPDDPELLAFVRHAAHSADPVGASDAGMIRVVEDLVDLLIERGLIRFTDLPSAAQAKLTERRHWRTELRKLSLLDDDSSVI